jgi:hypothetical protein
MAPMTIDYDQIIPLHPLWSHDLFQGDDGEMKMGILYMPNETLDKETDILQLRAGYRFMRDEYLRLSILWEKIAEFNKKLQMELEALKAIHFQDLEAYSNDLHNANDEITQLKANSKWVSIKERLPEDGQEILAWQNLIPHCVRTTYLKHNFNGFKTVLIVSIVTHWMQLPEPPETMRNNDYPAQIGE